VSHNTGTDHLLDGKKKDATYVASLFDPWIQKLDPQSLCIDCIFFDGASNVQKAGQLLAAKYPRIHVQTCAAHSVSLFFSDISKKLWQIRLMLVNYRRLFRLFGSGSMHSPYALFCQQSKIFNGGRKVGLLRAADTRMAGHAYAQVRMLRLREPLIATITSAAYIDLKLKGFPKKVEAYLQNADMWEACHVLQRCLFPMIRVLRLADKAACGGMCKIVYYVHQTDAAILNSVNDLRDLKYFNSARPSDANDDDGLELDDLAESDDEGGGRGPVEDSDDDDDVPNVGKHLGEQFLDLWNLRRKKLITPFAIAGWFCSPAEDVRKDVLAHGTGAHRLDVEFVIGKLYYPIQNEELGNILGTFWLEFNDFQFRAGVFARSYIWSMKSAENDPHVWHKLNSFPHTEVFGKVACRVCSKALGCGGAERSWAYVKHLKNGKRSHLSAEKSERQATVYGAACMEKARSIREAEERSGLLLESRWTDADLVYHLDVLENVDAPIVAVPLAKRETVIQSVR
jgi:hypothetical protein